MNYTVTKLDKRHAWHSDFAWMVEFRRTASWNTNLNESGVLMFDRCRRWFNEKFGWSQDVETRQSINRLGYKQVDVSQDLNNAWAYSIKYSEYRIYIADDATLNWFTLSFPNGQNH